VTHPGLDKHAYARAGALESLRANIQRMEFLELDLYTKYPGALDTLYSLWYAGDGKDESDPVLAFHRVHEFEETETPSETGPEMMKVLTVDFDWGVVNHTWTWWEESARWLDEDGVEIAIAKDGA